MTDQERVDDDSFFQIVDNFSAGEPSILSNEKLYHTQRQPESQPNTFSCHVSI